MNKIKILLIPLFFVFLVPLNAASAKDVKLVVEKMEKINNEEISVQYSVINRKNHDLNNMIIAFKIIEEGVPVGCKEIKTNIPGDSDGSDTKETKIKISGNGGKLKYKSNIFYWNAKRYAIDKWFSECPGF